MFMYHMYLHFLKKYAIIDYKQIWGKIYKMVDTDPAIFYFYVITLSCIKCYMNMFKYHIIHESVSVTYDTLTGALCHGSISVTNYTMISMYQMLQFRVPYAVLCGIVWVSESCIICT